MSLGFKSFLVPINLNNLELRNAVIQNLATAPASTLAGQIYFNTGTGRVMFGSGTGYLDYTARANHSGTQLSATISDLAPTVKAYTLDSFAAPVAPVNINSQRLTNVGTPSAGTDGANMSYVDTAVQSAAAGIVGKPAVAVVSVTNQGTLSGSLTIDGVSTTTGMRVLLVAQTTTTQNGVYIASSGAWARPSGDPDANSDLALGATFFVEQGTSYASSSWRLATPTSGTITPGTTAVTFTQLTAAASYTATYPLLLTGNAFSLNYGNGLTVLSNNLVIDATKIVQKYVATIGDGTSTSITVTHGLNNSNPMVQLRDTAGNEVLTDNQATTANAVVFTFSAAPSSASLVAIIQA